MLFSRRLFLTLCGGLVAAPVFANQTAEPSGRVMLTVSGKIGTKNAPNGMQFDRAMLESLDWRDIETFTSFTTGPQRFSGPTLQSVLEAVQAEGETLQATAINDYSINFPTSYASDHSVILALDHNGKPMRIRDKGPIWVVFPLEESETKDQPFDPEMIWQLDRIVIQN